MANANKLAYIPQLIEAYQLFQNWTEDSSFLGNNGGRGVEGGGGRKGKRGNKKLETFILSNA